MHTKPHALFRSFPSSLHRRVENRHWFSPFHVVTEAPPASLTGSAVSCSGSTLEPDGTCSVQYVGSPWPLLIEASPAAPSPPQHCHINQIHWHSCKIAESQPPAAYSLGERHQLLTPTNQTLAKTACKQWRLSCTYTSKQKKQRTIKMSLSVKKIKLPLCLKAECAVSLHSW